MSVSEMTNHVSSQFKLSPGSFVDLNKIKCCTESETTLGSLRFEMFKIISKR